jgi:hypothetical protein
MWIHYCCLFETPKGKIDAPYDQNITPASVQLATFPQGEENVLS